MLVMTAMLLLVLMGFAALAVDAAAGWSNQRQVRTAADMSALAAAEAIVGSTFSGVNGAAEGAALASIAANAPEATANPIGPVTTASDETDPCALRPAWFGPRVCLTNFAVTVTGESDNAFAPAIGPFPSIGLNATAEAEIYKVEYPDLKLLPVGVDSAGQPPLRCAYTVPPGSPGPQCYMYGMPDEPPEPPEPPPDPPEPPEEPELPPPVPIAPGSSDDVSLLGMGRVGGCGPGATGQNILTGVDHLVGTSDDPGVSEGTACGDGHELTRPTMAEELGPSGSSLAAIDLLVPDDPYDGHIWTLIDCPGVREEWLPFVPEEVQFSRNTDEMAKCLAGGGGDLGALVGDPRLGWAVVAGGGDTDFVPVWIHSLIDDEGVVSVSGDRGYSVFVLSEAGLPSDLREVDPTGRLSFKLVD